MARPTGAATKNYIMRLPDRLADAAGNGDDYTVREWLGSGGNVNARISSNGFTMLMAASSKVGTQGPHDRSTKAVMELLLSMGADVDAVTTPDGRTPLMYAAFFGRPDNVQMLLTAGAKTGLLDCDKRTAREIAEMQLSGGLAVGSHTGHRDAARLLSKHDDDGSGSHARVGLSPEQNIYLDLVQGGLPPPVARKQMHNPALVAAFRQHHGSKGKATARPEHQREYYDFNTFGWLTSCKYEDGDAEILVCAEHKQEFCASCACDFTDMNHKERREARAKYAAADAAAMASRDEPDSEAILASFLPASLRDADPSSESERKNRRGKGSRKKAKSKKKSSTHASAGSSVAAFTPKQIHVAFGNATYSELAPGTQITMRSSGLRGTVLETCWEGKCDGTDAVGNEIWERDPVSGEIMPAYLVEYEAEDSTEYVLCSDVHSEWEVIDASASANTALDTHLASIASEQLSVSSTPEDLRSHASLATNRDSQAPSIPSSVATSQIPSRETRHGNVRFEERGYVKAQFQRAIKSANSNSRLPGLPNNGRKTWLLVHEDVVFCTDETMMTMITAWPMMAQGDTALIKKLTRSERYELNGRVGKLLEYRDGCWLVDMPESSELDIQKPAENIWIELKNLKPSISCI